MKSSFSPFSMIFLRAINGKANRRKAESSKKLSYALMEPRQLLAGLPVINEFLASNSSGLVDDNGSTTDWIEIFNAGDQTINLAGYSLTDNPGDTSKFVFGSQLIGAGDYLVVFAGDDAAPTVGNDVYTGFGLSSAGEYVGLYDPFGAVVSEFSVGGGDFPTQVTDVSYGLVNDGNFSQPSYFSTPTPGFGNVNPVAEIVDRVNASLTPGFYDTTQTVALSTATDGATILYTTDGSTPTASNGTTYSGPINISGTTTLRAVAVKPNSLSVPDRTWSYLFIDDILTQSNDGSAPAGWPTTNINGQQFDYGIDPDVIAIEGEQAVRDALLAIPSWSITTDAENLFDPATGIYVNALEDGALWERPASVELIQPDGSEGFQVNAGIRIRGGFSRNDDNPKHAFRLFFRSEYGDSELNYPVHGDRGTDTFEKIDLRTAQNYSWSKDGDSRNTFLEEVHSRQNQAAAGQPVTQSSWLHLYVNGQYFGLFQTQERADANFGATYLGGDPDNFDVIKPDAGPRGDRLNEATDGNLDAYERLFEQAFALDGDGSTPNFVNNEAYYRAQGLNADGSRNPNYEVLLDVDNLITYMTEILYSMNRDAPISGFFGNSGLNNYYAIRDRTGDRGFIFVVHDAEHSTGKRNEERFGPYNNLAFDNDGVDRFNPQSLHQKLMANAEYRLQFADHIQESFFNGGVYTTENLQARWNAEAAKIESAIIAESARWGDAKTNNGSPLLKSHWEAAVENTHDGFLATRNATFLQRLRNTIIELRDGNGNYSIEQDAPLFPNVDAPNFVIDGTAQHGGQIDAGAQLQFLSSEGTTYFTTDGSDPRLTGGNVNPSAVAFNGTSTSATLFGTGSSWSYLDTGEDLGDAWRTPGFNDSAWEVGNGQLGYGDGDETTVVDYVDGPDGKNITTYFRREFTSTGNYALATLSIQRDDGVVVYVNGIEVVRDNLPSGLISFDTPALSPIGGGDESNFLDFLIPAGLLVEGTNTIAVEIHQVSGTSSDISFDASLTATTLGSFVTLDDTSTILARNLRSDGTWSPLQSTEFSVVQPSAPVSDLRISEIHFNPADPAADEIGLGFIDNDDFEFLELYNSSSVGTINLSGVQLSNGVAFAFGDVDLRAGERAVVVEDIDAFMARYGDSATILGQWSGGLNNGGEQVTLIDGNLNEIVSVNYGDNDPWDSLADGNGFSLVLDSPSDTSAQENGKYYSWRASSVLGGTPGAASVDQSGVVINEVLANSDAPLTDSIELYNTTDQAIDVSLWFLSDSVDSPFKYRIPSGAVIPAGGYLVFDESDFNPTPNSPNPVHFALSSGGDQVLLSRAILVNNEAGVLVEDSVSFGATFTGESLGRLPEGTGRLTRLESTSFGSANGVAEVGPLVISEVNYHPENPNAAALAIDPLLIDNDLEYIEIANPTSAAIDLTNWRLRGEADYDFVAGTSLGAGEAIVLVSFDPSNALNANKLAAFRAHYGIGTEVTIVGGLSASLSNSTGRISLQQPDTPDLLGIVPRIVVDEVVYDDSAPWADADGSGFVLERDDLSANGNLATNWVAAASTLGDFEQEFLLGDTNADGVVNFFDISPFIAVLSNGEYLDQADINRDGVVDFFDISPFIELLSQQ